MKENSEFHVTYTESEVVEEHGNGNTELACGSAAQNCEASREI